MKLGQLVRYVSAVNGPIVIPAKVVKLNPDGTVDVMILDSLKCKVPVKEPADPAPFMDIRGQKVPLSYVEKR